MPLTTQRKKAKTMYAIVTEPWDDIVALYSSRKLAKDNLNDLLDEDIEEKTYHIVQVVYDYRLEL